MRYRRGGGTKRKENDIKLTGQVGERFYVSDFLLLSHDYGVTLLAIYIKDGFNRAAPGFAGNFFAVLDDETR